MAGVWTGGGQYRTTSFPIESERWGGGSEASEISASWSNGKSEGDSGPCTVEVGRTPVLSKSSDEDGSTTTVMVEIAT